MIPVYFQTEFSLFPRLFCEKKTTEKKIVEKKRNNFPHYPDTNAKEWIRAKRLATVQIALWRFRILEGMP